MYVDKVIGPNLKRRIISESKASEELTWHRDANDRIVLVLEGRGWSFQRDDQLPFEIVPGDRIRIRAGEWHRVIPGQGNLQLAIKEIAVRNESEQEREDEPKPLLNPKPKNKLLIDLIKELNEEEGEIDLDGTEDVADFQDSDLSDEERTMLVSEDDLLEALVTLRESKKKKINPDYLTKDAPEMRGEIRKHAKKSDDDPTAYKSYPKGDWKADYSPSGKRYKTKTSPHTAAFHKRFGEADEINEGDLNEDLGEKIVKALKNKAEKANAPLGALKTIYRKGLAAWKTGHKPGAGQHQWSMARVNSVLVGGPARRVDAAQWKQIQDYRKNKRKN